MTTERWYNIVQFVKAHDEWKKEFYQKQVKLFIENTDKYDPRAWSEALCAVLKERQDKFRLELEATIRASITDE